MWTIEIGNSSFFWPGILAVVQMQASFTILAAVLGQLSRARNGFRCGVIASLFPLGLLVAIFPDWFSVTMFGLAVAIGLLVACQVRHWSDKWQARAIALAAYGATIALLALRIFREPNINVILPHLLILVLLAVAWWDIERRHRGRARPTESYSYDDGSCNSGDDGSCSFGRRSSSSW